MHFYDNTINCKMYMRWSHGHKSELSKITSSTRMCTLFKSQSHNYGNSTMPWTHLLYSYWLDVTSYIINIIFVSEQQWESIKCCVVSLAVLCVLLFTRLETGSWGLQYFLTRSIITRVSCLSMHRFKCFNHETKVSNTKKAFSCFFLFLRIFEKGEDVRITILMQYLR